MDILVVDDDLDLCRLLSRYLERQGYRVHSAGDALQALDVLARQHVGLVITDYMMPHMDGVSFTEQIRADPHHKDLPIIMMTAHPTDELSERSLRKGVAMMLAKPIDFERLLTLVRFAE